jgi:nucleoid-associated protein YgaU
MATHRSKTTHPIRNLTAVATTGSLAVLGFTGIASAAGNDWSGVAECESSGDWNINTGNGYYGGLQFSQSTWDAYKPAGAPARADQASQEQQIQAAEATLAAQGINAWPICGAHLKAGVTVTYDEPAPATPSCGWTSPVDAVLTQGFHSGHDGIDLGAPYGTPIVAAASGTVTKAGPLDPGGYGNYVEQITDEGYTVQYGHISEWYVQSGDYVHAGAVIGAVGNAGSSTGPHLHLRVYDSSGSPVDPETLFYCTPAPEPAPAPEPEPAPEPPTADPGSPIYDELYTIVTGDTLSDIAARVDLTWQTLADMNPYISNPDLIYAGDTLKVVND